MDRTSPPPSWVEREIIETRASQTYRNQVVDEWYETLPVPAWDGRGRWRVIGFGKNARRGDAARRGPSRPPHLACVVRYPDGARQWSVEGSAQHAWPASSAVESIPSASESTPVGSLMERRRAYYGALSTALAHGAFTTQAPTNKAEACVSARTARNAFLPAATYANLVPVYAVPFASMDAWLASNCPGLPPA